MRRRLDAAWERRAVDTPLKDPYAALILNRFMGPWSAGLGERDGSVSSLRFDPDMPPPDFVPVFPGARVVQSSRLVSKDAPSGVGFHWSSPCTARQRRCAIFTRRI